MRIEGHAAGVAALRQQMNAVLDGVQGLTDRAREKLARYQRMKRQAEMLLDEAAEDYDRADEMLSRGAGLAGLLGKLRCEQRELNQAAMKLNTEPAQLKELRAELRKIGDDVHELKVHRSWGDSPAGVQKAAV